MIEAYAFLAAFTVQVLVMSVLFPAWFIRHLRVQATRLPAERVAQLYPGVDLGRAQERFLTQYRALTTGIAVLGLLLLGWLFSYMRRPDWDDGPVKVLVSVYFLVAMGLPFVLVVWLGVRFNKEHKISKSSLLEGKRKAILQRRGLFDFVSPFVVFLAVLGYFLFAAFVISSGFTGSLIQPWKGNALIVTLTLVYALNACVVYMMLYGKRNPFETHAGRLHTIGLAVKTCVYSCIAGAVFFSLTFTLKLLELQRWEPFALSVFLVITALLASIGFIAPRKPEVDGLGSNPVS